ncbi:hypothetical protein ABJ384_11670 [Acinetobacter sp. A1-4-2]|jgi:hypothetical protein|uniref:Uncharacterized protein n=1 Tax=Acinetobacter sp. A1-4-2 TaxID=3156489 RepID=A0AAU7SW09_9GAMM
MLTVQINFKDKDLFGNDAADQEKDVVFKSYAMERTELEEFLNYSETIQIARAYKGEGKSAILRMVKEKLENDNKLIVINSTGVALSPDLDSEDSDTWTRAWKKKILGLIANEIGAKIGFAYTDDSTALVEQAEMNGFKSRSFISHIVDRLKINGIPQHQREGIKDVESILSRWTDGGGIWLIVDDIDQNFQNTGKNKLKVATYFTAIRQIVNALPEIRIRTSVRPNVWKIIKREFEALSHIEQYMVDIRWGHQDITKLLAKRIQGYLERTDQWNIFSNQLSDDLDKRNNQLISLVFEEDMKWGTNNRTRPASIVLATLSRYRPRWLVELCKESAKSLSSNSEKITFSIIDNELEDFGKRRIDDTIAEFVSQCPNIEEIIVAFSKQNERYTTSELLKLIDNRILNHINLKIFGVIGTPNNREVAHFLYQIAFITARQDNEDGSYDHISFEKNPSLLKSRTNVDDGMLWEIHPVFRQALHLKNVETKQAQEAKRKRTAKRY